MHVNIRGARPEHNIPDLEVLPDTSAAELRVLVAQRLSLPEPRRVRLIHGGTLLADSDTLGSRNITDGAAIHMVVSAAPAEGNNNNEPRTFANNNNSANASSAAGIPLFSGGFGGAPGLNVFSGTSFGGGDMFSGQNAQAVLQSLQAGGGLNNIIGSVISGALSGVATSANAFPAAAAAAAARPPANPFGNVAEASGSASPNGTGAATAAAAAPSQPSQQETGERRRRRRRENATATSGSTSAASQQQQQGQAVSGIPLAQTFTIGGAGGQTAASLRESIQNAVSNAIGAHGAHGTRAGTAAPAVPAVPPPPAAPPVAGVYVHVHCTLDELETVVPARLERFRERMMREQRQHVTAAAPPVVAPPQEQPRRAGAESPEVQTQVQVQIIDASGADSADDILRSVMQGLSAAGGGGGAAVTGTVSGGAGGADDEYTDTSGEEEEGEEGEEEEQGSADYTTAAEADAAVLADVQAAFSRVDAAGVMPLLGGNWQPLAQQVRAPLSAALRAGRERLGLSSPDALASRHATLLAQHIPQHAAARPELEAALRSASPAVLGGGNHHGDGELQRWLAHLLAAVYALADDTGADTAAWAARLRAALVEHVALLLARADRWLPHAPTAAAARAEMQALLQSLAALAAANSPNPQARAFAPMLVPQVGPLAAAWHREYTARAAPTAAALDAVFGGSSGDANNTAAAADDDEDDLDHMADALLDAMEGEAAAPVPERATAAPPAPAPAAEEADEGEHRSSELWQHLMEDCD